MFIGERISHRHDGDRLVGAQFRDESADSCSLGFILSGILNRFSSCSIDRKRLRGIIPPVKPFPEKEIAEPGTGVAARGVDERTCQFRNYIVPRHDNFLPVGRVDRKAVAVAKGKIVAIDQFDPAPVV